MEVEKTLRKASEVDLYPAHAHMRTHTPHAHSHALAHAYTYTHIHMRFNFFKELFSFQYQEHCGQSIVSSPCIRKKSYTPEFEMLGD